MIELNCGKSKITLVLIYRLHKPIGPFLNDLTDVLENKITTNKAICGIIT